MRGEGLGLVAALPHECRDILHWKGWRRLARREYPLIYERGEGRHPIRLVVSGMGGRRAVTGLTGLLDGFDPGWLLSFGFGGALEPGLTVGDLVWGKRVLAWHAEGEFSIGPELSPAPTGPLGRPLGTSFTEGFLISVDGFVKKDRVRRRLERCYFPAILEMETYALSVAAEGRGIPISGLRAVSDEWDFDVGQAVGRWVDEDLDVRGSRMLRDVIRHPQKVAMLWRLFRRSRVASRSLGRALRQILDQWQRGE